jgi:hypothetical protein
MLPIRRVTIIIPMGTTCGRTSLILNNTRIITPALPTGITGIEFTTATTVIITTTKVPAKPQWCEIRNTVLSWTRAMSIAGQTQSGMQSTLQSFTVLHIML